RPSHRTLTSLRKRRWWRAVRVLVGLTVEPEAAPCGRGRARRHASGLELQVVAQLPRGDLRLVGMPFLPLIAQEELEDMLAEGFGHHLRTLHLPQRIIQVRRQIPKASGDALPARHQGYILFRRGRQLVALADALQA